MKIFYNCMQRQMHKIDSPEAALRESLFYGRSIIDELRAKGHLQSSPG